MGGITNKQQQLENKSVPNTGRFSEVPFKKITGDGDGTLTRLPNIERIWATTLQFFSTILAIENPNQWSVVRVLTVALLSCIIFFLVSLPSTKISARLMKGIQSVTTVNIEQQRKAVLPNLVIITTLALVDRQWVTFLSLLTLKTFDSLVRLH